VVRDIAGPVPQRCLPPACEIRPLSQILTVRPEPVLASDRFP
jgi:hypothetical protein